MKQTIFASDLDNTLIFSAKHALDTDLCVEYLDGKPQGYLPPPAPAMLEELMEKTILAMRSCEEQVSKEMEGLC